MGGATQANEHHSAVINTRQYRAPEVIMRCDTWDTSSDIWSLACLIVELYTGRVFIKVGNNDLMHLAIIQSTFGPIPLYMKQRSKYKTRFNSLPKIQPQKQLHQIIEDQDLLDLLNLMFQIDQHQRINCKQILEHKFFQKLF